jgi:hypothetical protein
VILPSNAYVRFGSDGPAQVDASLHLSGATHIQCCIYPDESPILSVNDRHVSVSITVPDRHKVTSEDLDIARQLADAVAAYVAELEHRMAVQGPAAEGAAA